MMLSRIDRENLPLSLSRTQAGKGGKQIAYMQNVANNLPWFDHTGPGGQTGYPHAAFGKVTFAAGV